MTALLESPNRQLKPSRDKRHLGPPVWVETPAPYDTPDATPEQEATPLFKAVYAAIVTILAAQEKRRRKGCQMNNGRKCPHCAARR